MAYGLRPIILALAAVGLLAGSAPTQPAAGLVKFVDPLPVPPRLKFGGPGPHQLTVTLRQFQSKLHRDLPASTQWGYDGLSPGPTIEVERGTRLEVLWKNELPTTHLFPVPKFQMPVSPDVRSVTHLHGAEVPESDPMDRRRNDDGWPDAWTIPGEAQLAVYPNQQSARTLWYHDHAMAETGRNVAAGLLGLYEIHDDYERSLNLPAGDFEIPLLLQSRQFRPDGSLTYSGDITAEFYGNAVAVNGKFWPYLNVEPRKYRFRFVNGSNARSYGLKLIDQRDHGAGPAFYQIGSDSGFLEEAAVLNDPAKPTTPRLVLAPAERADVVIDFAKYAGRTFLLQNNSRDPADAEVFLPEIMEVRVGTAVSAPDTSHLPLLLKPIARTSPKTATVTRQVVFDQMKMPNGMTMVTLNGKHWNDPVEEKPVLGSTEIWNLVNPLIAVHPFHIHLVQFQVLDRRLFDVQAFLATGRLTYLAPPVPPPANEMGWKDTVRVLPQMVTRIIMKFAPYPGFYVYHCHILEHEDMDMMRPFQIVKGDKTAHL